MATVAKKTYYQVAGGLLLLLAATVGAHFLPLGHFGVVVALGIAFAKMALIVLFFMHVRYSSRLTMLFAIAGLFWLLLMFLLTFGVVFVAGEMHVLAGSTQRLHRRARPEVAAGAGEAVAVKETEHVLVHLYAASDTLQ